jgi:diacylglycerol kinase family enzyme
MLYRVYSKTLHKSRYAKIIKATKATVYNMKSGDFHIDGEPVDVDEVINIAMNKASLKIFVPKD